MTTVSPRSICVFLALTAGSCTCQPDPPGPDGGPSSNDAGTDAGMIVQTGRCDLDDLDQFIASATGAGTVQAKKITSSSEQLAGPVAFGKPGDYLLQNELIRVVIQGPGRLFGPLPYGGTILDADLVRADGGSNDQLGEVGLLYNFGRTVKAEQFDVLRDGSDGRAAVIAASGDDAANDYLSIRNKLADSLGKVPLADPYVAVPVRITNYFILNAKEQRVRFVTAFCNTSLRDSVALAVGDLTDPGDVLDFFNPNACTDGFGFGGNCFGLDRMSWYGYEGKDVAYGYAPYKAGSPLVPEAQNATLSVAGITGSIVGSNGLTGLASWVQATTSTPRDGEIRIPPGGRSAFSRDFWVAHTLGEVGSLIAQSRAQTRLSKLTVTVRENLQPVEHARIALDSDDGRAVFTTGADGTAQGQLPARVWKVTVWKDGHAPSETRSVDLSNVNDAALSFDLTPPHRLTVKVREALGGPMPAKVTVLCTNGPCAVTRRSLIAFRDVGKDPLPDSIALVGVVGPSGTETFDLPAAQYLVLVSRGPEYSVFPNDYPTSPGAAVDLRAQDVTLNAVLAHVIDTTGFMSADFHVHAVNSPDSIVSNDTRALSFAADGVDVIVSTDHDVITDYGPVIARLGLSPFLSTVIGEEVSPMEWGHYNAFPLVRDAATPFNGGAIDWAGGDGPTLTVGEIFAAMRAKGAKTVHFNHPRGSLGGLSYLRVDTDTLATHADPVGFRMSPQPGATANDSKLLSTDFNALELLNPGEDSFSGTSNNTHGRFNDWFTLLSRGFRVAGTGVSDTHYASLMTGWRTWVDVGSDGPTQFDPLVLSDRLNSLRAVVSNGPFVSIRAYRVDAGGAMVTSPVGLGGVVGNDPRGLGVTVEVQVPEYLDVTKIELYMHVPEDDASCPVDPQSSRALTTRVACDGALNTSWPSSSIAASQVVALTPGDLETVASDNGTTFKRYRKSVNFKLPAPSTDNWVVAMVYGSKNLAPLLYPYPGGSGAVPPTAPFAFTNPIFIDADGNGYDKPPFKPQGLVRKHVNVRKVEVPDTSSDPESIVRRWKNNFDAQ